MGITFEAVTRALLKKYPPQMGDLGHLLEDIPFGPVERDADGFYHFNFKDLAMPGKHGGKKGKGGKRGGKKGGKKGGRRGY